MRESICSNKQLNFAGRTKRKGTCLLVHKPLVMKQKWHNAVLLCHFRHCLNLSLVCGTSQGYWHMTGPSENLSQLGITEIIQHSLSSFRTTSGKWRKALSFLTSISSAWPLHFNSALARKKLFLLEAGPNLSEHNSLVIFHWASIPLKWQAKPDFVV